MDRKPDHGGVMKPITPGAPPSTNPDTSQYLSVHGEPTEEMVEVGGLLLGNVYHMTPTSKSKEMTRWGELKAGPRGKGGHGYPDDLIIPLCDEINSLPHVCTLQSCAGHKARENECEYPGNLWLWFSRAAFDRFLVCADAAALVPGIEHIRILYRRYNDARTVVEVVFDGYNKGAETFDRSIRTIMRLVKEVMPNEPPERDVSKPSGTDVNGAPTEEPPTVAKRLFDAEHLLARWLDATEGDRRSTEMAVCGMDTGEFLFPKKAAAQSDTQQKKEGK